ncbi:heat shock factor protein 3 [Microcaecilia unicolor]|uniref:Heat shock factor protein 3-like n=1 Tax=Microcaecilia unicolor TaxID=1415580 RepID=A0A6P7YDT5_9AMPH|nr:heat shock factor protein 3-like [Microcaecilia unicolor]
MKESSAAGLSPLVPAFLTKLWTLVEDPSNDDVICWSWNGQNFSILDEQRFAKEIIPKYFKHNNISSFIRQLNMYGFRKVVSLENGLIKPEKGSALEFQHPFFKQGKAELLENIKRKVSVVRSDDSKLSPDDLQRVLFDVQEMRDEQISMDAKLDNMRKENKALWKEVSSLRRKHSQQQKLLSKILQFILSLVRGNYVVGAKRKRPLTLDVSDASPAKYSCQYLRTPVDGGEMIRLVEDDEGGVVIKDITNASEAFSPTKSDKASREDDGTRAPAASEVSQTVVMEHPIPGYPVEVPDSSLKPSGAESDVLELHPVPVNDADDPASVIDAILNENSSTNYSDTILDREEIQDFLNCIDTSLEELQAMLFRKKSGSDFIEILNSDLPSDLNITGTSSSIPTVNTESSKELQPSDSEGAQNKDKQLMQYRCHPLLSLFEELPLNEYGRENEETEALLAALEGKASAAVTVDNTETSPLLTPTNASEHVVQQEPCELPLLTEDLTGEYKLLPLFVLSPVNNLIDEATGVENV